MLAFAYTETDVDYVIANTKKLPAATVGFIEASIRDIVPSEVKDLATGYKTAPLQPTIEVVTSKGTRLSAESSALTADFNTSGEIYGGYLRHNSDIKGQFPANFFDNRLRPSDPDDYYYVTFTTYAFSHANQYFNVNLHVDATNSENAQGALILGIRNQRTGQIFEGNGSGQLDINLESNCYQYDGQNFMATIYVAYPKRNFPANQSYNMTLQDTYTMETIDDHNVTSTDAQATVPFSPVLSDMPNGGFYVEKQGDGENVDWIDVHHREGIYDTAFNKLMAGQNIDLKYWMETRSRAGQFTLRDGGDPKNMHDYGQKEFQMITTDDSLYFGDTKLDSGDAVFKSLDFQYMMAGYDFTDLHDVNKVINPLTNTDFTIDGEHKPIFGYKDAAKDRLPVVEVFAKCEGDYGYEQVASVDYRSGKPVLYAFNGARADGTILRFKPNTVGYQLKASMSLCGYMQDVDVDVMVKPSDRVMAAIRKLYDSAILPRSYLSNKARLDVVTDGTEGFVNEYIGRDQIMGFADGVKPEKKLIKCENDVVHSTANLTYELSNTVQTNLLSKQSIKQARDDKWIKDSTHETFYDFLPKGMVPVTSSIKSTNSNDSIDSIKAINNYKNSGRVMLIVKLRHLPDYKYHLQKDSVLDTKGYYDRAAIRFVARYNWLNLKAYGDLVSNIMACDSNVRSGTVKGLKSESDVDSRNNQFTRLAFRTNDEKNAFRDLRGNLTFARSDDHLTVDSNGRTSLLKQVDVNDESLFNDGLDEHLAKNVYLNGHYTYAISIQMPDTAKNKDMIFYDSIENFKPKDENADDATWRGTLESVNLDSLIGLGVKPVVYYSTRQDLVLDDENNRADLDLNNTDIWSRIKPDAKDITAIAVDARRMADGSPFVLDAGMLASFKLNMRAPKNASEDMLDSVLEDGQTEAGMTGGAHAYNNVVLTSRQISVETGAVGPNLLTHNDYTKVGLKLFQVSVKKAWDDDNDRDGLRQSQVEFELYANDEPTGKTVTLSEDNHWRDTFGQVPYVDAHNSVITYTIKEVKIDGYRTVIKDQQFTDNGLEFTVLNRHDPEKIAISGEKIWENDNYTHRPQYIQLILKADGKVIREQTVSPILDNKWTYNFGQLFKYRDHGKKIVYELFEKNYVTGYVTKIEGFNVHNIYDPFTDVTIKKQVSGSTDKSREMNPDFTFRLNVTDLNKNVVNETYDYTTTLGRSGKLSVGQEFTLKDKEELTLTHVPSERIVNITEGKLPNGYRLEHIDNNDSVLQAGKPVTITAKNCYEARGRIKIHMTKSLLGRKMKPYEFKFELLENNKGNQVVVGAATNDPNGNVDFYIPYSNKDSGTTRHYTVREVDGSAGGITYDKSTYPITVHIDDDGQGKIIGTVDGDNLIFENSYHAKGTVVLKAWKVMSDHSKPKAGEYKFDLCNDGNAGDDNIDGGIVASATNDKDGCVSFSLDFTEADVGKTYKYLAVEDSGDNSAIEYDFTNVNYSVTVFDRGDGTLGFKTSAKDNYTDDEHNDANSPVFYNKVKDGSLTISKLVQQGDPAKTFKFKVKLKGYDVKDGNYHITRKSNNFADAIVLKSAKKPVATFTKDDLHKISKINVNGWKSDVAITANTGTGEIVHSGTTGSVSWSIDDNGTLLIKPTYGYSGRCGKNTDANPVGNSSYAWTPYNNSVNRIQVQGTVILPANSSGLFKGCKMQYISDFSNFDISDVYDLSSMFEDCSNLISVNPLAGWYINGVGHVDSLFKGCSSLVSINALANWDTSNVINLDAMFEDCSSLTSISPLSNWNTSNAEFMSQMFKGCSSLTSISPLSNWNTSSVKGLRRTFQDCSNLTSISPLGNWDVSNVLNMGHMFHGCSRLTSIDALWYWNTSKVYMMEDMFEGCSSLTSIDPLFNWNTSSVEYMTAMFNSCSSLTSISALANWNTRNVKTMAGMFNGCTGLTSISPLSCWNTRSLTNMASMFNGCTGLTSISALSNWDTSNVLYMVGVFGGCSHLLSVEPLANWDINSVTSMDSMFYGCSLLKSIDALANWATNHVKNMRVMFCNCSSLTSVNNALVNWNTSNVTNMYAMFYNCSALTSICFGDYFDASNVPVNKSLDFKTNNNLSRIRIPGLYQSGVKYIKSLPGYDADKQSGDKWIREDRAYGPYTPQELYDRWTPSMSGWWIRQKAPVTYTVLFDFQGSGQSENAYIATRDKYIDCPKITVQPVGKVFKGWSLTRNGDIITSLKNLAEPGQTVTLYAIWGSLSDNVDIHNGEFTIEVPAGESATIDGLAAGTDYEVEELQTDGWVKVEEMNSVGKILPNKDQLATFINHFAPMKKQASVRLQAKKLLDGKPKDGFEFELLENGRVIDSATSQFDGTVSFTPINYSEAGTHFYQIREKVGNDKSITYDTTVKTVWVDVRNRYGRLEAAASSTPVFNNTTKTGSLDITKAVDNRNDTDTSFDFILTIDGKDQAFSLNAGEHKVINNLPIGTIYFLKEINIPQGYSQVNIDNPTGIIMENETAQITVTNTYHYSGSAQFKAHKVLEGGKLTSGQFTFRLSKDDQTIQDVQNDGNGDINFDAIEFNKPGTYHYTISEVGQVDGIKMDNHTINVNVTATAQDDGKLNIDVDYDGDTTFTNKVEPPEPKHKVRTNIKITKKVVGIKTDRAFEISVDSNMLENDVDYEVTSNKSSDTVYLNKNKPSLFIHDGETLTIHDCLMPQEQDKYISEKNCSGYDCKIEVNSELNEDDDEELHYIVTNIYHASGQLNIKGIKKLIGGNVNDYRFKFLILKDDDIVSTGYNNGENISFTPIYYTEKDLGKTYVYTVVEDTGINSDIDYDTSVKTIKVAINDSDDGKVSFQVSGDLDFDLFGWGDSGYSVTFVNKMAPDLPITGTMMTACILSGLIITLSLICLVKRKY